MLRAAVILLFVANVLVLAWQRGWIAGAAQPAPRLEQQLNPDRLSLLNQKAVTQLATLSCVELGPLTGEEPVRRAAAALTTAGIPSSAWQMHTADGAGVWALATIKMPSKDFRERKEDTYRSARIAFEPLQGFPDEQPTLVLSKHDSEAAAQAALDAMTRRNYKGLRVLRLQAPQASTTLRLARLDGLQVGKLDAIASPPWGSARKSCEADATPPAPAPTGSAASR
ncbi:hypothetical protein [Roseateles chitosanitabidus]|jgi:hypothetical protein|uniref:hypothetical protein n=1 Tax=Roseateles chitosanitabidus TaxID=65048 RepID=UPI00083517F3|nr:hypothetical protein [Roseateles chitosanitabidus]MBO9689834.1 hypothetical protein [Roseateles chitosanitabidus]